MRFKIEKQFPFPFKIDMELNDLFTIRPKRGLYHFSPQLAFRVTWYADAEEQYLRQHDYRLHIGFTLLFFTVWIALIKKEIYILK